MPGKVNERLGAKGLPQAEAPWAEICTIKAEGHKLCKGGRAEMWMRIEETSKQYKSMLASVTLGVKYTSS